MHQCHSWRSQPLQGLQEGSRSGARSPDENSVAGPDDRYRLRGRNPAATPIQ
jgi:hypothetical protein